jgi:hypothetical protein
MQVPNETKTYEHDVICVLDIGYLCNSLNMPIILIHVVHATPNGWGLGMNFGW